MSYHNRMQCIFPRLIDRLLPTRYNQTCEVPIVLIVGERVGRYYRELPIAPRFLEAHQIAAPKVRAFAAAIRRPHRYIRTLAEAMGTWSGTATCALLAKNRACRDRRHTDLP